jgi:transposase
MQNINACLYVHLEDRAELERLVGDGKTAQKIATRARIVLASGRGLGTNAIMREARTSKPSVWRWQKRYMEAGIKGLFKDRGKGKRAGKKPISEEIRLKIITKTVQERPANATHWSVRTMAKEMNVSHTTCAAHLEGARAQAASHTHLQALELFSAKQTQPRACKTSMHAFMSVGKTAPTLSGWSPTSRQHKRLPREHASYSPLWAWVRH